MATGQLLSGKEIQYKVSTIAIVALISSLLIDSLLSDISTIINQSLPEISRIALFTALFAVAGLSGSRAVIYESKKIKNELGFKNYALALASRIVPLIQYAIIGLLGLLTLQIIFGSQYLTVSYVALIAASWTTGALLMAAMSFKFIQWYRTKRNRLVLLYLVSSLMFCVILGASIVPQSLITLETTPIVNANSSEVKPFQANPQILDTLFAIISIANWLVIPLALIIWAATAVVLRGYSKKYGVGKYWLMISAPLASLIIASVSVLILLPTLSSIFDENAIPYAMLAFGGILTEGFLLGFAFIITSRTYQRITGSRTKINYYLDISARGVVILFVSFFANPSAGSYLPFGVIAASFFAFGAYLFFTGIYSSAISVSGDMNLRKSIRKSAMDQSKLLGSIGTSQMKLELQKRVLSIAKSQQDNMLQETGVQPSLSEHDMKEYLDEVISEIKTTRST
jgi:hypothetical protein